MAVGRPRAPLAIGGLTLLLTLAPAGGGFAAPATGPTLFVTSSLDDASQTAIDLHSGAATRLPISLSGAESLAVGAEGRVYVGLSGGWGGERRIVRFDPDGSHLEVVLDFAATPELAQSGGPEGLSFSPSGELFFNTRAATSFPHTGVWRLPADGGPPQLVVEPYTDSNAEATAFLTTGPYAGSLVAADYRNGRIVRVAPPFDHPQPAIDFIRNVPCPNGIAISREGEIFVADEECARRIARFNPDGTPLGLFAAFDLRVRKIAFDAVDNLYAATVDGPVVRIAPGGEMEIVAFVREGNGVGVGGCADLDGDRICDAIEHCGDGNEPCISDDNPAPTEADPGCDCALARRPPGRRAALAAGALAALLLALRLRRRSARAARA